eukprot:6178979-Pleurochrysis_carterae.AAC.1
MPHMRSGTSFRARTTGFVRPIPLDGMVTRAEAIAAPESNKQYIAPTRCAWAARGFSMPDRPRLSTHAPLPHSLQACRAPGDKPPSGAQFCR